MVYICPEKIKLEIFVLINPLKAKKVSKVLLIQQEKPVILQSYKYLTWHDNCIMKDTK